MKNQSKLIIIVCVALCLVIGGSLGFITVRSIMNQKMNVETDHQQTEPASSEKIDGNVEAVKNDKNNASGTSKQNSNGGSEEQSSDLTDEMSDSEEKKSLEGSNQTPVEKKEESTKDTTPFETHGKLMLDGVHIVDSNQQIFQLKGVSTHGLAWFPAYANADAFRTMRDEWGINTIRLAMYTAEYNGYCTGDDKNRKNLENLICESVEACKDLGLYVIIDWHVLQDKDPSLYQSEAITFFTEMSARYADYDNVIYEICNEPNGDVKWSQIKAYADMVIPAIRENDEDAIVIVGTPTWSQDADLAAKDPITGYQNIMYAVHFYAATHKENIQGKMMEAYQAGIPVIVSEFGICDASGNGGYDEASADSWMNLMNQNHIGYIIWNLSNKNETSALILSDCTKTSEWTKDDLTGEALWYIDRLGGSPGSSSGKTENNLSQSSDNGNTANGNSSQNGSSVASAENGDLSATVNKSNSWVAEGNTQCYQFDITVSNSGKSAVTGWSVTLTFKNEVEVSSIWNASITYGNNSITVTPVDYNKEVGASGSVKDIGMIITSKEVMDIPQISIQ